MAVIALSGSSLSYSMGISTYGSLNSSFSSAKRSSGGLCDALSTLKNKIDVSSIATNVDSSQEHVSKAQERETTKINSLTIAYDKLDTLIIDTGKADLKVSSKISSREDDFYKKYSYLKPECKKSKKEKAKDWCEARLNDISNFCSGVKNAVKNVISSVAEWCKSNIGKIVLGVVAVIGAVLVIVAVIASGGLALVPILTAWGISTGIATTISLSVATVALVSTTLALVPNSIDLVAAIDEVIDPNSNKISDFNNRLHSCDAYNMFQNSMNITSAVSGGIYSIGSMYNASKGISNADLKAFRKLQLEGYRPGFGSGGQDVSYLSDFFNGADNGIIRDGCHPQFYSVENSNGGKIYVSNQTIKQSNFANIVDNADGSVNIITGGHGDIDGIFKPFGKFLTDDINRWGEISNVSIFDMSTLSTEQLGNILNSNGTNICAWCYSERSKDVLSALGLL